MAKPKLPSQKKAYAALLGRINQYTMLVQGVFDTLASEGAALAAKTGYEGEAPFSFKDYPQTADAVRKMQEEYVSGISGIIHRSTAEEWKNSNLAQDLIADKAWAFYTATERGVRKSVYYQTNSDVLLAFQKRKDKGLGLSERLWGQSREYKEGMEAAISTAVEKGISAVTLSKRVSQYLKDFPSMRKDYTRRYGKALDCRDCQYESIRLARTEINMAYRMAEQERWRQFDFVLAYDIKMSKSHRVKDICDDLAGRYPKTFTFKGWHPNCFCYCVPVLKTEDEFFGDVPVEPIKDVPDVFRTWVEKNEERIKAAKSLPYFIMDNNPTDFTNKYFSYSQVLNLRKDYSPYFIRVNTDDIFRKHGFSDDEIKELRRLFDHHKIGNETQKEADFDITEAFYDNGSRLGKLLRLQSDIEENAYRIWASEHGDLTIYRAGKIDRNTTSFTKRSEGVKVEHGGEEAEVWTPTQRSTMNTMLKDYRLLGGWNDRTICYQGEDELFFIRKERKYAPDKSVIEIKKKRAEKEAEEQRMKSTGIDPAAFKKELDDACLLFMEKFNQVIMSGEDISKWVEIQKQLLSAPKSPQGLELIRQLVKKLKK